MSFYNFMDILELGIYICDAFYRSAIRFLTTKTRTIECFYYKIRVLIKIRHYQFTKLFILSTFIINNICNFCRVVNYLYAYYP